jgi:D-xylonolactonase
MTPWPLRKADIVWPAGAILGESPVWSPREHALWWVDIKGLALFRYAPDTGAYTVWESDEAIGSIDAPDAEGRLLAATRSGFAWLVPDDDGSVTRLPIAAPEINLPGNRFNDGKRAPDGSFWAGTMDDAEASASGAWWRLDPATGRTTRLDGGYRVTNGPAFDPARNRVYLTDSARQTVYAADWLAGGGFSGRRVFLQFGEGDGYPDGMQVDAEGALWIAFWGGACLRRFDPDGDMIQTIPLPALRPTSLAFAPEIDRIFVTSASIGLEPGAAQGALMAIPTG